MMASYEERIYVHDDQIIPPLASHLPHSCTVLRCIQHGIAYPSPTATILATFPPGAAPEHPWMAAYVDLFRGRETQMVIYSSLEAECTSIVSMESDRPGEEASENLKVAILDADPEILARVQAQLLSLLSYTKAHLRPAYLSSSEGRSALAESNAPQESKTGIALIPVPDPRAFLIGSLHTGLYALLQQSGTYTGKDPIPGVKVHRIDNPPYNKFIFPRSAFRPEHQGNGENDTADLQLPAGYRYHDRQGRIGVLPSQFDLVQSRTHIPRSRKQLSSMPGVAIYFDDPSAELKKTSGTEGGDVDEVPIAWAFIGKDGALATLHVEPEHRGRGLALRLAKEVMRIGMAPGSTFGGGENGADQNGQTQSRVGDWVHTEVAQYNQASRRVMEKIGGQVMTTVVWTVIELCD